MCEHDTSIGHNGADASFVQCQLVSIWHFTPLANECVQSAPDVCSLVPNKGEFRV